MEDNTVEFEAVAVAYHAIFGKAIPVPDSVEVGALYSATMTLVEPKPDPGHVPPWDDLPSWVKWRSQDEDGEWIGHDEKPRPMNGCWLMRTWGRRRQSISLGLPNHNWRGTLEARPEPEQPRPEFVCPDCGAILEKDVYEVRSGPCTVWVCECLPAWNRRA